MLLSYSLMVAGIVILLSHPCSAADSDTTNRLLAKNYQAVRLWGSTGTGPAQFDTPCGIAVDRNGTVYVADSDNHRVQTFTSTGQYIASWPLAYPHNKVLGFPMGISVSQDGAVFVSDGANHCIDKYSSDGNLLLRWGTKGTGNGQFQSPCGIALDADGNVYVCDMNNHRIQVFTAGGVFIRQWDDKSAGGTSSFIAVNPTNQVIVTCLNPLDNKSETIRMFTRDGNLVKQWGAIGQGQDALNSAVGVAVDAMGNIYITDIADQCMVKYDSNGTFLTKWGSLGEKKGGVLLPRGIAVDAQGNVYVTEVATKRVQVFAPQPE